MYLDIVFDGPPSHESGRFVEVEDAQGRSINAGEWIDRGDGYWALRIGISPPESAFLASPSAARPEREEPHYDWECDTCHVNWKGDPKPCPKCGGKNFIHRYGSNAYELRDAVSAPSAAVAWEPIEDAPKSTEVLVLVGKARYIAYQTNQPAPMMNTWRHPNGEQLPGWPTHYLPLPPIPSSKE